METINCPECGCINDSDSPECPSCGFPFSKFIKKEALDSLSWEELSSISAMIASAQSTEAALTKARDFGICNNDHVLNTELRKNVVLSNGLITQVQIIGLKHDIREDGRFSGLTFLFRDCVEQRGINVFPSNDGGWERSDLRNWLSTRFYDLLPHELQAVIVPVKKFTNNRGETSSTFDVTPTTDLIWLLSLCEAYGDFGDSNYNCEILNEEGVQYKLFKDAGIGAYTQPLENNALIKKYNDEVECWWTRSAFTLNSFAFRWINKDGARGGNDPADFPTGIVPGFCI